MEFVQVRLLLNRSDPFPEKIVRERLTWSSAFYGERLRDIVDYGMAGNGWGIHSLHTEHTTRKKGGLRYGCK